MLALPLWYKRQINRPGSNLTGARWDALHSITLYQHTNNQRRRTTLNLLQVYRERQKDQYSPADIDILYFRGNLTLIDSIVLKAAILFASALAAVAYVY